MQCSVFLSPQEFFAFHVDSSIALHKCGPSHKVSPKDLKVPRMHVHMSDDLMVTEVVQCEWNHDNNLDNLTSLN